MLQRRERLEDAKKFVAQHSQQLLHFIANGSEVVPEKISPRLELVKSESQEARLFRFASLTWSVPVSEGYGRRMRFLVWDDAIGKLMGIIALGDPVFNLRARDAVIGWNAGTRAERLVGLMDAYVLGAVAPYSMLLGGKAIACFVRTSEVRDAFRARYGDRRGIISKKHKRADLLAVTTSSALGRSSVYNRLKLGDQTYFSPIGFTAGFGHFHVPSVLFEDVREYLRLRHHEYAEGNRFGNGPNWKFRAIRAALELLGVSRDYLHHGVKREVFICALADNAFAVLAGRDTLPKYGRLQSLRMVGELALERWILPRAQRRPEYRAWSREQFLSMLDP